MAIQDEVSSSGLISTVGTCMFTYTGANNDYIHAYRLLTGGVLQSETHF